MIKQFQYYVAFLLQHPEYFDMLEEGLEGPDSETLREAFHALLDEVDYIDNRLQVVFRMYLEDGTVEVVLSTGQAVVITLSVEDYICNIQSQEEMGLASELYYRLVRAIERELPSKYTYNIALVDPPCPSTNFLISPVADDVFCGKFYHLDDPTKLYDWIVKVVDPDTTDLKAEVIL
jgi:hypothetical protein